MEKVNKKDLDKVNQKFDIISNGVKGMEESCRELMPLVADSLELTYKLIRLYKEAFNKGLQQK